MLTLVFQLIVVLVAFFWVREAIRYFAINKTRNEIASFENAYVSMDVSIIIPAWNEATMIEKCLTSIRQIEYPGQVEIIIVAGGNDETYQIASNFSDERTKVIKQLPLGKNAALNQGLMEAKNEIIVLLDADCIVDKHWLRELIAPFSYSNVIATTGNYYPLTKMNSATAWLMIEKIVTQQIYMQWSLSGCGSIALRSEVIKKLKKFDDMIRVGVDWYLDRQLRRIFRGKKIVFSEKAKVNTCLPFNVDELVKDYIRFSQARLDIICSRITEFLSWKNVPIFYPYFVSCMLVVLPFLTMLSYISRLYLIRNFTFLLWFSVVCWVILKNVFYPVEVGFHMRKKEYIKHVFSYPMVWFVIYVCHFIAIVRKIISREPLREFRGPRPELKKLH